MSVWEHSDLILPYLDVRGLAMVCSSRRPVVACMKRVEIFLFVATPYVWILPRGILSYNPHNISRQPSNAERNGLQELERTGTVAF